MMAAVGDDDIDTSFQEPPEVIGVIASSPSASNPEITSQPTSPSALHPESTSDVRRPYKVEIPDEDTIELPNPSVKSICNLDVRSRLWRYFVITSIPIAALIALNAFTENAYDENEIHYLSRAFGLCIGALYTCYFVNFASQLWPGLNADDDAYLFKVHTYLSRGILYTLMHMTVYHRESNHQ